MVVAEQAEGKSFRFGLCANENADSVQGPVADLRGRGQHRQVISLRFSERYHLPVLTAPAQVGDRTLYRVRILVGTKPEAEALTLSLLRDDHISASVIPTAPLR